MGRSFGPVKKHDLATSGDKSIGVGRTFAAAGTKQVGVGRTFAVAGVSKTAGGSVSVKKNDVFNIVIYLAIAVLLIGGCVFGYMAFSAGQESVEVNQTWNGIRTIANDVSGDMSSNAYSGGNFDNYDTGSNDINNALARFDEDSGDDEMMTDEAFVPNTETGESESVSGSSGTGNAVQPSYYSAPMDRVINWDKIIDGNPQVKCWLYVPNTNIDYPVIQELKLGEYYYLDHDYYGNATKAGSIVTSALPEGCNTDAHLMILGHNMKNTTMFGTLRNYRSASFYQNNPYFYIYYPDRVEKWAVWSCYHCKDTDIIYDVPYELGSNSFAKLVNQINEQQAITYKTGINNTDPNRSVVTLSTCENIDGTHSGRFVVNAILSETKKY